MFTVLNFSNLLKLKALLRCGVVAFLCSSSSWASDYAAVNCEVWVDKIAGLQIAYHPAFGAVISSQLFLKVNLSSISDLRRVVFFGAVTEIDNFGLILNQSPAQEIVLLPYWGSSDYYEFNMGNLENYWWDESNRDSRFVYKGSFFAENSLGDRFWVTPGLRLGEDFVFDESTVDLLRLNKQIYVQGGVPLGEASKVGLEQIWQTYSYNGLLNPHSCR